MAPIIQLIPRAEFLRIQATQFARDERLALVADMCRANTLASVKRAGSGHLGSSFSSLDIVTWLYFEEMNTARLGIGHPDRDVYFSSKGHDVPGLYSVLFALGILPAGQFMQLRRLGGTFGHPDVRVPGIEANTGSLGMGVSKGKGIAIAKRLRKAGGRVYVMTGDGELQEGQIYEALLAAANQRVSSLTVIVDHNKLQSDRLVHDISDLGDLEAKGRAFGWHVVRCSGHDFTALEGAIAECRQVIDRPQLVIADTIKGRGVSFMEHPAALVAGRGSYRWHAGAPDDESFTAAYAELTGRINDRLATLGLASLTLEDVEPEIKRPSSTTSEYVARAYGDALVELAPHHPEMVILDGDLAVDCHIRKFELSNPGQFIENGIAEQDMVSTAGGMALAGFLPIVNTFASFLSARANEQIYNNGCERTRVIYAAHYAGLLPAGPGATHQSIRDISLVGALPNIVVIEPCNSAECRMIVEYAITRATDNVVIRMIIGPSPRQIALPPDYALTPGRGVTLTEGSDALLFAYGPVMLHEALAAHERLASQGFRLRVVNMPWLNRVDGAWLADTVRDHRYLFVVDDHSPVGGLGDCLLNALNDLGLLSGVTFRKIAVEGYPACGTPDQVLPFHGLDAESLARYVASTAGVAIAGSTSLATMSEDGWAG
jgi:transketolase